MIRARFEANEDDPRPIKWPYPHPYWHTGQSETHSIIVAYADNEDQIKEYWPEAINIDSTDEGEYTFTDRFAKPVWFEANHD